MVDVLDMFVVANVIDVCAAVVCVVLNEQQVETVVKETDRGYAVSIDLVIGNFIRATE
jgi:hypothetical protein